MVQGAGLRTYVYNQVISPGLKGWINNNSQGVHIDIESDKENIKLIFK
ncbi:MAG: acylphosphatase [Clostridiaceae bacterium]